MLTPLATPSGLAPRIAASIRSAQRRLRAAFLPREAAAIGGSVPARSPNACATADASSRSAAGPTPPTRNTSRSSSSIRSSSASARCPASRSVARLFETAAATRSCDAARRGHGIRAAGRAIREVLGALRACRATRRVTVALPGRESADFALEAPTCRPAHPSRDGRNPLSHALGDGARLLRASRARPRRRARPLSLPVSRRRRTRRRARSWPTSRTRSGKGVDDARVARTGGDGRERDDRATRRRRSPAACAAGGELLIFGNGGSATDATDWAIDCVSPPPGLRPVPALSLALEPATSPRSPTTSAANSIFLRQLIAHARPARRRVALSTSGGSTNVIAALEEARKRGNADDRAARATTAARFCRRGLADHVHRRAFRLRAARAGSTSGHLPPLRHALDWLHDGA